MREGSLAGKVMAGKERAGAESPSGHKIAFIDVAVRVCETARHGKERASNFEQFRRVHSMFKRNRVKNMQASDFSLRTVFRL